MPILSTPRKRCQLEPCALDEHATSCEVICGLCGKFCKFKINKRNKSSSKPPKQIKNLVVNKRTLKLQLSELNINYDQVCP